MLEHGPNSGQEDALTTNLTRADAQSRSALLTLDRYDVVLDLSDASDRDADTFISISTVAFHAKQAQRTFIDIIADAVVSISVNGHDLNPESSFDGARVVFDPQAGDNTITVVAQCVFSRSGEGMHRFFDPADDRVYLYSQFEPTDARRVFANFDQPDLKARFRFTVLAPESFVVLSNSEVESIEPSQSGTHTHHFALTPPQSSYITCVCAGHWAQAHDEYVDPTTGQPIALGVYARQSLADVMDGPDIFEVTRQGLEFFHSSFDYAYPWGKYDQIFVPEYNLGAMENPGLVTFTDAMLHRGAVTRQAYASRAEVILHEMAHMWFGDLVTMKWWDDLWLKESFADFMATLALTSATQYTDGWVSFALKRKAWAYSQDQYPTTHPIVADIPDVEAARLNFDGITYAKGAAVLKQLVAFVGLDAFLAGARSYFRTHQYSATTLNDFLTALSEAAPDRDVLGWARAWLQTTGVSELQLTTSPADGPISSATLSQRNSDAHFEGPGTLRPHTVTLAAFTTAAGRSSRFTPAGTWTLDLADASAAVSVLTGEAKPDFLLLNSDDADYAKVRLDADSTALALSAVSRLSNPLDRAVTWSALNNALRDGLLPVREWVNAYCRALVREEHPGIAGALRAQMLTAVSRWAHPRDRDELVSDVLGTALDVMGDLPAGSDAQLNVVDVVLSLLRVSSSSSSASPSLSTARLWASSLLRTPVGEEFSVGVADLRVDHELRWKSVIALAAIGWLDDTEISAELASDRTGSGQLHARTARAAVPLAIAKARAWDAATGDASLSNDAISAAVAGFTIPTELQLIEPFVSDYFDLLEGFWAEHSIEIAKRLMVGLYPHWSSRQEFVLDLTTAWLDSNPHAPAAQRRILVELRDDLQRSLRLQSASRRSRH